MKIWLDDTRHPGYSDTGDWIWCLSVEEAVMCVLDAEITGEEWTDLSLDHDLGDGHDGIEFVNWMRDTGRWPKFYPKIHSMNPVGRKNMEFVISRYFGDPNDEVPL